MNKVLIPKLRFPEFKRDEYWDIKSIEELCEVLNNTRKPITSSERKRGIYPYYGASGIIDFINDYIFDERLLLIGEDGAKWGAYESTAFLVDGKYWVNNHAHVLKPKLVNEKLLECYLVKLDLHSYITGAAPPKLTLGKLKQISVPVPVNQNEQQRIAECFSSLDELITNHIQKLVLLKDHKKGLIQNLFPQENKAIPKRRFPEFMNNGDWIEGKLGDMTLKVGSGSTPLGGELVYKKNGRPFVRSQNIGWGILLINDIVFIDEQVHQNSINTEIEEEDVLLNITGASIGRSAVASYQVKGGNVNQHVCIIRTKAEDLNPFFVNQYLISSFGQKQIDSFQAGGNRQGLNFPQIRSLLIPMPPTIEEQKKIASCLFTLDKLITAQAATIEHLRQHKKGLMQGLFPKIND